MFSAVALWRCGAVALWRCGAVICSFSAVALWVPVQRCGAVALWEHATAPQHLTLCFCAVGCSGCPFSAVALWGARSALWRCGCPFSAVALCFARSALWRCGAVKRCHSATALNTGYPSATGSDTIADTIE